MTSKLFYIWYAAACEYYGWGIADEEYNFYRLVKNGIHVVLEYQAEIKEKYVQDLKNELLECEDDRAYESIIKKYEIMED